jgi:hypothetical protein
MDVYALKNFIINKPEYIELILETAGFHNITHNPRKYEYRCAREEGRNPTSIRVDKRTLGAICFSTNFKGNIITLVQSKLYTNFPRTVKKIAEIVNFESEEQYKKYSPPFGGYYKKIARLKSDDYLDLEVYPDNTLLQYEQMPNFLFNEDGILPSVQQKFNIGYDSVTGRITVPWYFTDGLIGVMGRLNKRDVSEDETKWFPVIPFPKSKVIYGFMENYNSILEKGIVLLGESEKHSMGLASKGLNVGISLGGSFISEIQANHIKSLFPEKIIVMLDEGLGEEHSIEIAKQLKSDRFYENEVGYIFDRNNEFLSKGGKQAPADLDKKSISKLIQNHVIWI